MKTEELRRTIGGLFEALPELESIELTHGGQKYRAYRSMGRWACVDTKAKGRGWDRWTEWPLSESRKHQNEVKA